MTQIGLGLGFVALVAQSVVGRAVEADGVRRWASGGEPASALAGVFQVRTIISVAILEGAAFANLMFYMVLEHSPWSLAMAGLLVAAIATKFPTAGGIADWCTRRARDARS